jgi:hypothetical protein
MAPLTDRVAVVAGVGAGLAAMLADKARVVLAAAKQDLPAGQLSPDGPRQAAPG